MYGHVLPRVFPFCFVSERENVLRLAAWLAQPEDTYAAGGSSYAVTARPHWTLWLSEASLKRLLQQEPRLKDLILPTYGE